MINELQLSPEDAYDRIAATVDGVNKVISSYVAALASQAPSEHKKGTEELAKQWRVAFEAGTVVVASGYQGWGFSCSTLADLYVDCSGRAVVIASAFSPLFLTAFVVTNVLAGLTQVEKWHAMSSMPWQQRRQRRGQSSRSLLWPMGCSQCMCGVHTRAPAR